MIKPPPSTTVNQQSQHGSPVFCPGLRDQHGRLCPAALRGSPLWSRACGAMYHRQLQSRGRGPTVVLVVGFVVKCWVSQSLGWGKRFRMCGFFSVNISKRRFTSVPSLQPKTGLERGALHGISWTILRENLGHRRQVAFGPFSIAALLLIFDLKLLKLHRNMHNFGILVRDVQKIQKHTHVRMFELAAVGWKWLKPFLVAPCIFNITRVLTVLLDIAHDLCVCI